MMKALWINSLVYISFDTLFLSLSDWIKLFNCNRQLTIDPGFTANLISKLYKILVRPKDNYIELVTLLIATNTGNLSINPLMGHLLDTYGWRVTFRMMCAFVVTAMLISIAFYRKPDSQKTNDAESQS